MSYSLDDARNWLAQNVKAGVTCPCCQQFAKEYRRKLNSGMAHALLLVYRDALRTGIKWLDLTEFLLSHGTIAANSNAALLRHWELLEQLPGERDDGSGRIGWYRLSPLGGAFAAQQTSVAKYVYLYDNRLLGRSDGTYAKAKWTNIEDALGSKFNYRELMKGY